MAPIPGALRGASKGHPSPRPSLQCTKRETEAAFKEAPFAKVTRQDSVFVIKIRIQDTASRRTPETSLGQPSRVLQCVSQRPVSGSPSPSVVTALELLHSALALSHPRQMTSKELPLGPLRFFESGCLSWTVGSIYGWLRKNADRISCLQKTEVKEPADSSCFRHRLCRPL